MTTKEAAGNGAGTEVAQRDPAFLAQLELIHRAILGEAELPATDPAAMSRAIMERILSAETFEEAFTQQNLTPWRSLVGVPVVIPGPGSIHFNRSGFEGQSVYAVVDLITPDGQQQVVSCGGQNVLAQLVAALQNGWLGPDYPVRMVENDTAEGYKALWLEAADA